MGLCGKGKREQGKEKEMKGSIGIQLTEATERCHHFDLVSGSLLRSRFEHSKADSPKSFKSRLRIGLQQEKAPKISVIGEQRSQKEAFRRRDLVPGQKSTRRTSAEAET